MSEASDRLRVLVALADADEAGQVRDALAVGTGESDAPPPSVPVQVTLARDADAVAEGLDALVPDLVVLDPKLPGGHGLELVERVRARVADAAIVILTEQADSDDLYEVVRLGGIRRYLLRPWREEHGAALRDVLADAAALSGRTRRARLLEAERNELTRENAKLRERMSRDLSWEDLPSESPAMAATLEQARRRAADSEDLCLIGPSGSGRLELARAIHLQSARASAPLVSLNTALTGVGALATGWAEATGGTLVLRELEALDDDAQAELLRLRAEAGPSSARPRLVALGSVSPEKLVAWGALREELARPLIEGLLRVPGLDERRADLPALAERILERLSREYGGRGARLSEEARAALATLPLEGQLPELEGLLERAVAEADGASIARLPPPAPASDEGG